MISPLSRRGRLRRHWKEPWRESEGRKQQKEIDNRLDVSGAEILDGKSG
jgi:hypothetical protein